MKVFDYFIKDGHGFGLFGLTSLYELQTTSGKLFLEASADDYVDLIVYNDDFSKIIIRRDGHELYEDEEDFSVEDQLYDIFDDLDDWLEDYEITSIEEASEEDFDRWSKALVSRPFAEDDNEDD